MREKGWHAELGLTPPKNTELHPAMEKLSKTALLEGFQVGLAVASQGLKHLSPAERSPGSSAAVQKRLNVIPKGVCSCEWTLSLITLCEASAGRR